MEETKDQKDNSQTKTVSNASEDNPASSNEEQNKPKDPAVKDREKKKHYYGSFLIDGSVAVVLFVLAFLDKFRLAKQCQAIADCPKTPIRALSFCYLRLSQFLPFHFH